MEKGKIEIQFEAEDSLSARISSSGLAQPHNQMFLVGKRLAETSVAGLKSAVVPGQPVQIVAVFDNECVFTLHCENVNPRYQGAQMALIGEYLQQLARIVWMRTLAQNQQAQQQKPQIVVPGVGPLKFNAG